MLRAMLIGLFLLGITPVRLGAAVALGQGRPRWAVGVMLWGVRLQGQLTVKFRWMEGAPQAVLCLGKRQHILKPRAGGGKRALALIRALLKTEAKRRAPSGFTRFSLSGAVRVGGEDAALVAQWTGALRALGGLLPGTEVACFPAFGGTWALRLRCIAETRLGILWAAALRTFVRTHRAGRKEDKPWIIPSET